MERKSADGPKGFQREHGPWREKAQMDQIIIRGSMVHGEEKCGWTKLFSVEVWSMKRKRAGGPNSFQQEYGPWREKVQMDQMIFREGLVHGEKRINGPNLHYKE